MSLVLKNEKKKSEPVAAGTHHGVLYGVIDIGTQPAVGNFPAKRKAIFLWELPHETITIDGEQKRRGISQGYTLSLNKKSTLAAMLTSWLGATPGDGFDLRSLVGRNCQLSVVHQPGKKDPTQVYANVKNVVPLAKGMQPMTPENDTIVFTLPDDGPIDIPSYIPEWIQNRIKESLEWKARADKAAATTVGGAV